MNELASRVMAGGNQRGAGAVLDARTALRTSGDRWIAFLRAAGVSLFFIIAVVASIEEIPQWRALLPLSATYFILSIAAALLARRRGQAMSAYAVPFADVSLVFVLQLLAVRAALRPGFVAGWSVGVFAYLVMVSALTFRTGIVWITAAAGAVAETLLLWRAGLQPDTMVSSAALLGLTAFVARFIAGRIEASAGALAEKELARICAEQRAASVRAEQEQARMWTDFVVHDLRQPLTGAIALIDAAAGRAAAQEELALAAGELQRLARMIDDLLMVSRLEHNAIRPQIAQEPLFPLLSAIVSAQQAEAATHRVALSLGAPQSLSAHVDAQLLRRAVENLLANALRYAPPGGHVQVVARLEGPSAVVAVRNDGPRIREDLRPRLFQRFASAESDTRHAGLGLYFCRLVAEAHGGSAEVGEAAGWNVEFRLRFAAS